MPIKKSIPKAVRRTEPERAPAKKPTKERARSPVPEAKRQSIERLVYDEQTIALSLARADVMGPVPALETLPGAQESCASLAGQTWEFKHHSRNSWTTITHFFEDGTVNHNRVAGRWRQRGAAIVFEVGGRYAEFIGVISGDTAAGQAKNTHQVAWSWSARLLNR